jgi:MarR family transcriptional regulator for hemolysin
MYVEPMTLVGYLDSLEKSGLIRRQPDPSDKRAKLVLLTEDADPLLERISVALEGVRARALEGVMGEDRKVLETLLQNMKDSLLLFSPNGKGK